jgi:Helix-turn-helix domain
MAREAPRIDLSPYEVIDLRRLANAPSTPQALAFRVHLLLRCDSAFRPGVPRNDHVATALGCDPGTVAKWRRRFRRRRLAGLSDLPRSGRPAAFSP